MFLAVLCAGDGFFNDGLPQLSREVEKRHVGKLSSDLRFTKKRERRMSWTNLFEV